MKNNTATFAKLPNGSWGLRGDRRVLVPGRLVTVVKKNGTRDALQVGEVVWTDGGTVLATIR